MLDATQARRLPTGRVIVTVPAGATDRELADAAGYCWRHLGFMVTRHDDDTATVSLWND